ncbi:hypothetical protein RG47T_3883 [Mucilaginibacter polytrichastri]|uniref:Uncharacterized protein n=1 Tax=Mucilaginibacter polytrichastri TaxID=1302689 RepID=A0A1Q6A329_9SPHI|nr:hypothetical protein RG47T_3883 [Mucilaginibacter polytrichastri]
MALHLPLISFIIYFKTFNKCNSNIITMIYPARFDDIPILQQLIMMKEIISSSHKFLQSHG